jgi:Recombination endonuclease VII
MPDSTPLSDCFDPDYVEYRNKYLMRKYGINFEQYLEMYAKQEMKCAICSILSDNYPLSVDHTKCNKKIRALLCKDCNAKLGMYEWSKFTGWNKTSNWPQWYIDELDAYILKYGAEDYSVTHYPNGKRK